MLEAQLTCARSVTRTGVYLGSGAYCSVIELQTSSGELVAGKVYKATGDLQLHSRGHKVCGEVITMLQLDHPNIVRCKGACLLPDQTLPVLLMERLMTSLHSYLLDPVNTNLPVERKISILLDTARGLEYLHSRTPAIIHRDLTAKNVLLDSQLRAKIADFGNSRIMDLDPSATPSKLVGIPGTVDYMPVEVLGVGGIAYGPSFDVFSFGHLSLFTVIQSLPRPLLPPTYTDSTLRVMYRSELMRRAQFVVRARQVLSESHPLLALLRQCLHNQSAERPRTGELVAQLRQMRTSGEFLRPVSFQLHAHKHIV